MIVNVFGCVVAQDMGGPHGFVVWRQNEPVLGNAGVSKSTLHFTPKSAGVAAFAVAYARSVALLNLLRVFARNRAR